MEEYKRKATQVFYKQNGQYKVQMFNTVKDNEIDNLLKEYRIDKKSIFYIEKLSKYSYNNQINQQFITNGI